MRICWICERRIAFKALRFVIMEDDGCGEYECIDKRDCYFATTDRRYVAAQ